MTLVDDATTPPRPPHRTWHDLPATPPIADVIPWPEPAATAAEAPTDEVPVVGQAGDPPGEDRPTQPRPKTIALAVGAAIVVVGLVAGLMAWQGRDNALATPVLPSSNAGSPAAVAAALAPAVVQIEVGGAGGIDLGTGIGSGVIYDTAGLILTAHHVVAGADEVTVRTADERTIAGRVVGRIPERDLAIVALDNADDLVAAAIADPGSVEVGETAIALGSPFGFQQSVTAGIISGLDRELETPMGTLTGLIQTDAPINPGNSGGPLADAEARVIGINTAIASMSGGNDGVGFAIPVEDFADLLQEVEVAGGVDAPTVPAPQDAGGLGGLIPGLDQLPGLDQIPGLDQLPGLDELLEELLGSSGLTDELDQLLQDLGIDGQSLLDELLGTNEGDLGTGEPS